MMPCIMIIYAYLNAVNDKKILFCNHKIRRNEKNSNTYGYKNCTGIRKWLTLLMK